jgi:hypothetical protein
MNQAQPRELTPWRVHPKRRLGDVSRLLLSLRRERDRNKTGAYTKRTNQEDDVMKLTSMQVERTLSQFQAQAIPDTHPVIPQLNDLFGDHTFFLDNNGLNIVEPAQEESKGTSQALVVNLANWSEANPTALEPHEPEATDVVVVLDPPN